jgi:hypothetical protein
VVPGGGDVIVGASLISSTAIVLVSVAQASGAPRSHTWIDSVRVAGVGAGRVNVSRPVASIAPPQVCSERSDQRCSGPSGSSTVAA